MSDDENIHVDDGGNMDPCMFMCFPCLLTWTVIEMSCKGCIMCLCCIEPDIQNENEEEI